MKLKNKLFLGDCVEIMKQFPNESVDHIISDPPYNIGDSNKLTFQKGIVVSNKEAWNDEFKDDYSEKEHLQFFVFLSKEFHRILKNEGNLIVFFDRNNPFYLFPFFKKFTVKNKIVFIKKTPVPHMRKNNYRSGYEECYWFCKGKKPNAFHFISQQKMINVFSGPIGIVGGKKTSHPTEKYWWMIRPLVERHTNKGDLVLDPFFGSGTILVECKKQHRNYCGIEISPEFFDMGKKRLEKTIVYEDMEVFSKNNQVI